MTVGEMYEEAVKEDYTSLVLLIEYLCFEKAVLDFERDARNVEHVIQNYDVDTIIRKYKERGNGCK